MFVVFFGHISLSSGAGPFSDDILCHVMSTCWLDHTVYTWCVPLRDCSLFMGRGGPEDFRKNAVQSRRPPLFFHVQNWRPPLFFSVQKSVAPPRVPMKTGHMQRFLQNFHVQNWWPPSFSMYKVGGPPSFSMYKMGGPPPFPPPPFLMNIEQPLSLTWSCKTTHHCCLSPTRQP